MLDFWEKSLFSACWERLGELEAACSAVGWHARGAGGNPGVRAECYAAASSRRWRVRSCSACPAHVARPLSAYTALGEVCGWRELEAVCCTVGWRDAGGAVCALCCTVVLTLAGGAPCCACRAPVGHLPSASALTQRQHMQTLRWAALLQSVLHWTCAPGGVAFCIPRSWAHALLRLSLSHVSPILRRAPPHAPAFSSLSSRRHHHSHHHAAESCLLCKAN